MAGLRGKERELLELIPQGHTDIELCRELRLSAKALASMLDEMERSFGAGAEAPEDQALYYRAMAFRATKKAKDLDRKFRALMNTAPEAVLVVHGPSGEIKQANERAGEAFGYTVDELIGMSVEALVPVDVRQIHVSYRLGFLRSMRKRELGYHPPIQGVRKDGSLFDMAIALTATEGTDDVLTVCEPVAWAAELVASRGARRTSS